MPVYRVTDWQWHFENNRTKDLKAMKWVPIPNKMDGDGYTELVTHPHGAAHLGVWLAIVEIASKCEPRGTLLRDGRSYLRSLPLAPRHPHTAESMARISRLPAEMFSEVIPRLLAIGWLQEVTEDIELVALQAIDPPQEGAGFPQEGAALSRERSRDLERNGTEETGMNKAPGKRVL